MKKIKNKKTNNIFYTLALLVLLVLLKQTNIISSIDYKKTDSISLYESSVSKRQLVTLVSCIDGDTAKFSINGEEKKVRFLAIDTPETVHPYKSVEEYGKNASEYTCSKLSNAKKIELEYENGLSKTDKYNRVLAWIFVDDKLLQNELLSIGYAKVKYIYAKYKYIEDLFYTERISKQNKNGLWSNYKSKKYNITKNYTVTFKYGNNEQKIVINEGNIVNLINNPNKGGYMFKGWLYNGKLYDVSNPITHNLTLKASFTKK